MTPAQKLIDAAAEQLYEWHRSRGAEREEPWSALPDFVKDLYRDHVTIPVTVALRAAVEELKGWRDIYGDNAAAAISSLIPAQEKTNDA